MPDASSASGMNDAQDLHLPPIDQHRKHINLDDNENQNLDMLVSGVGLSDAQVEVPKKKKSKKKSKKKKNVIEVIEDANNITPEE